MNNIYSRYQKLIGVEHLFDRSGRNAHISGQEAAELLRLKLLDNKPLMISRFGSNELNCVLNYYFISRGFFRNVSNIFRGIPYFFKLKEGILDNLHTVAGFYPTTEKNIERYCKLTLDDLSCIDVLGSWLNHEQFLYKLMPSNHVRVRLGDLTPVKYPEAPWTAALKDRKVLVIHPFEATIRSQYEKRKILFKNKNMLPDFELMTLKAVQSVAGNGYDTGFKDWFEALDFMKEKIYGIDFDIAILGCGAYGMPLAAHIKRLGKMAFHLGGETQIMFGIKGKRWEEPGYNYKNTLYNEHWVRPLEIDTPKNVVNVEGGCYW